MIFNQCANFGHLLAIVLSGLTQWSIVFCSIPHYVPLSIEQYPRKYGNNMTRHEDNSHHRSTGYNYRVGGTTIESITFALERIGLLGILCDHLKLLNGLLSCLKDSIWFCFLGFFPLLILCVCLYGRVHNGSKKSLTDYYLTIFKQCLTIFYS